MSTIRVVKGHVGWQPNQPAHAPRCDKCAHLERREFDGRAVTACKANGFITYPHAVCKRDYKAKDQA